MNKGRQYSALVIGVSAGGLRALTTILTAFDQGFPIPVLVVQHLSDDPESYLHKHLRYNCPLPVTEPEDKQKIMDGTIYVAPPGYHMEIDDKDTIALSSEPRVNYSRPSIDLLFESAADVYTDTLIALILTGANADGTKGIQRVKKLGGLTIAQDPTTAEVSMMPQSAIDSNCIDIVVPLNDIAAEINKLVKSND
ncbi:MAG: chemotaxis protein CheB [Coxiellaceae bacterium]|nr:chemotaxis protein CheB [Coxiellaceae bacterium]